ncbi:MAG TPA: hypothetical protein VN428_09635 [Bryobacteraceae bacterium]|nr:hypothetical protein [Bryobacteraceae bacterium]
MKRLRQLYPWWYASLAIGFFLLGWNFWLVTGGAEIGGAALRWVIAAGFAGLAWMEFKRRRR